MATAAKPKASTKTAASSNNKPQDATALLRADHKAVSALFAEFETTRAGKKKKSIVAEICRQLTAHATVEEEIFYPAVQAALKDHELVPEANVEHASVKDLIALVKDQEPGGDEYDARVKVMGEFVKHHVKEEQNEMFPKVKRTKLDLMELGLRMAVRKAELLAAS